MTRIARVLNNAMCLSLHPLEKDGTDQLKHKLVISAPVDVQIVTLILLYSIKIFIVQMITALKVFHAQVAFLDMLKSAENA